MMQRTTSDFRARVLAIMRGKDPDTAEDQTVYYQPIAKRGATKEPRASRSLMPCQQVKPQGQTGKRSRHNRGKGKQ